MVFTTTTPLSLDVLNRLRTRLGLGSDSDADLPAPYRWRFKGVNLEGRICAQRRTDGLFDVFCENHNPFASSCRVMDLLAEDGVSFTEWIPTADSQSLWD